MQHLDDLAKMDTSKIKEHLDSAEGAKLRAVLTGLLGRPMSLRERMLHAGMTVPPEATGQEQFDHVTGKRLGDE